MVAGQIVQTEGDRLDGRLRQEAWDTRLVVAVSGLVVMIGLAGLASYSVRTIRGIVRQRAEAELERVRTQRLSVLGRLAGSVSHEPRNPLGVIKNSVYYLRLALPEDPKVDKHLSVLEREVATATRIVTDLLDFARVGPANTASLDLRSVISDVMEQTQRPDGVTVALELAPVPSIPGDRDQLRAILGNLVANALQAMPGGARSPSRPPLSRTPCGWW